MTASYTSVCTRCGKERIILKKWTETHETRAGLASISYTTMSCPDFDCQIIVDREASVEKKRKDEALRIKLLENESRKRAAARARVAKAS